MARGERRERLVEVEDAQAHACENAWIALSLGGEERQLAATGVRSDERELVRAVDHVHADVGGEEVRELVAVLDPEGHVVERLDLHRAEVTHTPQG